MRKLTTFMIIILTFSILLTGCGFLPEQSKESEQSKADPKDKENLTEAQAAQSVGNQPWFEKKESFYNSPPRLAKGGIWYHTKEEHAGNIDEEFDWDEVDVLHIQLR